MVQARPVHEPQGVVAAAETQLPRQSAKAVEGAISLGGATASALSGLTGSGVFRVEGWLVVFGADAPDAVALGGTFSGAEITGGGVSAGCGAPDVGAAAEALDGPATNGSTNDGTVAKNRPPALEGCAENARRNTFPAPPWSCGEASGAASQTDLASLR